MKGALYLYTRNAARVNVCTVLCIDVEVTVEAVLVRRRRSEASD